jgi:hypothetical protein
MGMTAQLKEATRELGCDQAEQRVGSLSGSKIA